MVDPQLHLGGIRMGGGNLRTSEPDLRGRASVIAAACEKKQPHDYQQVSDSHVERFTELRIAVFRNYYKRFLDVSLSSDGVVCPD